MARPVVLPNIFANLGGNVAASTLDANFNANTAAINDPASYANYAIDSGAVNAYAITLAPAPASQVSLVGVPIEVKIGTGNTGASTLNVNGFGAQPVVRRDGTAVQQGDMPAGSMTLLIWDGTSYQLQSFVQAQVATVPQYYIVGLQIVNNGATSMDIQAGTCADGNNTHLLVNASTFTKTQAAFAAGTGNGGKMSAAALANNTWYYFYALRKDADGTIEFGFDVSPTAPTAQAGYTLANYRSIGERKTQAASTNWDTFIQHGDLVAWSTPPALDMNGTGTSIANRTLTTVNVPAIKCEWVGHVTQTNPGSSTQTAVFLTDPACADIAPALTASPLGSWGYLGAAGAVSAVTPCQARCWTNTSSQIGVRGMTAAATYIQTIGWTSPRGKPV